MAVKKKTASKSRAVKKTPAKKVTAKKSATKTPAAKKPAAKKSVAKKAVAKKAPVKKAAAKKVPAKKAVAKKVPAKKAVAKKTPAKKAVVKKAIAKKPAAKKAVTKKPAAKKPAVKKTVAKKVAVKKAAAKPSPVKKAVTKKAAKKKAPAKKKAATRKRAMSKSSGSRPIDLSSVQILKRDGKVDDGPVVRHKSDAAKKGGPKPRTRRYNKRDLEKFGLMLSKLRSELLSQMNYLQKVSLKREDAGFSEEDGTDAYERQMALTLAGSESESVASIDDALQRITEGTYGTCIECSCLISKERLRAVPFGSMCIACKSLQEKKRDGRSRY